MKLLPLAALALVAAMPVAARDHPVDSKRWNSEYDWIFAKYSKRFFGVPFDWRWFKAQAIAESTLDPGALSKVGAVGLMQIMPATFEEIRQHHPSFEEANKPYWNIAAGIWYDRRMFRHKTWADLPDSEKLRLAFASYNAGLGGALRAFNRTPPPAETWEQMAPYAPRETRGYVARIVAMMAAATTTAHEPRPPKDRGISEKILVAGAVDPGDFADSPPER